MQLTPEELVREFHDAVMELYFARKRITLLEEENAALRAHLATVGADPEPEPDTGAAIGIG
ncbi:hypothetical protein [Kitasatospora viridis]|uniref:Uncharacterized protein n=1 Tax=Kitasatospora viridis TaxID=281105 RepID=A0A561SES1_9ACTN|nr:hypothetical protein [Kitasatospora viridis]TWF73366.1 hypothetical protein FHX73_16517 [Kitasatospora viridis]